MTLTDHKNDCDLVSRAVKMDADAMQEIVEQHQDSIYRLTYRLVGNTDVAQDLTQETFLKAFKNLDKMREIHALRPWLYQIATNLVRDRWRTQKKEVQFEKVESFFSSRKRSPLQEVADREMNGHIQAALMKLPHDYREAFLLKHVEELQYEKICSVLGIGRSAAKVRVHRACRALRDLLPEYDLRESKHQTDL